MPIVKQLREDDGVDADAFAEALEKAPESEALLVEETLIQIGRAKPGAIERLLARRGVAWALSTEGRELIGGVAGATLGRVGP